MYIIDNTEDLKRAIHQLTLKQSQDWYDVKYNTHKFLVNKAHTDQIMHFLLGKTLHFISNTLFTKSTLQFVGSFYIKRATSNLINIALHLIHKLQQKSSV